MQYSSKEPQTAASKIIPKFSLKQFQQKLNVVTIVRFIADSISFTFMYSNWVKLRVIIIIEEWAAAIIVGIKKF